MEKGINGRDEKSREDRWDAGKQRELRLGTSILERKEMQQSGCAVARLFLILRVSCSRKNMSKYGKPFTLHPVAGSSLLAFG